MQFKHPEILWALLLLLIPILIHLFQLRRFKKTPFTNVAMLQKVVSESRKSNQLKKWLLLLTRLLLLAALVIAFAQPFQASETALQEKETVIYLDNSFSMQAKNNGLSLLEESVQNLIKNGDSEETITLFTNDATFKNVTLKDIQNDLLSLTYSQNQLNLGTIQLKANSLFSDKGNTSKRLVLISDFQEQLFASGSAVDTLFQTYLVPIRAKDLRNISVDSIHLVEHPMEQSKLTVQLSGGSSGESQPISLYNGEVLIAKSSANFTGNGRAAVEFSIPANTEILGRIAIEDNSLPYDNQFYFNVDQKEKIKILSISEVDNNYLRRLYPADEFEYQDFPLAQLDYSSLDNKHVVILNGLRSIPVGLQQVLQTFKEEGGTIIVVPANQIDFVSYNQLLFDFFRTKYWEAHVQEKRITAISFDHPLYENVFDKRVDNFQYPKVDQSFTISTAAPSVLAFDGGETFLAGIDGFYFFTAALDLENSNFINSPLIVPTFYNMAAFSLKSPETQHTLGQPTSIDVAVSLGNDQIVNLNKENYNFIPLQQSFPNRVRLDFGEEPTEDGIYGIRRAEETLKHISFNYSRSESQLDYLELDAIPHANTQDSIEGLFEQLKADNSITAYWKWFVILALFLALVEVLIQKFVT